MQEAESLIAIQPSANVSIETSELSSSAVQNSYNKAIANQNAVSQSEPEQNQKLVYYKSDAITSPTNTAQTPNYKPVDKNKPNSHKKSKRTDEVVPTTLPEQHSKKLKPQKKYSSSTPVLSTSQVKPKSNKESDMVLPSTAVGRLQSGPKLQQSETSSEWQNFEFTEESERAYKLMMTPSNNCVFVTGKAGTGKSYLLRYFKEHTTKSVVFLAPTGIAALNVGGQTIHSFFKFPPGTINRDDIKRVRDRKIYEKLDTIVIDEVSMVRADMMDHIDKFLRENGRDPDSPFGGVQMIFFGDLYQLPPVIGSDENENKFLSTYYASPYFFDAKVFDNVKVNMVELNKVYRQKDPQFLETLNVVRLGNVTSKHISFINQRYSPNFVPPATEEYLTLTPNNKLANQINDQALTRLPYSPQLYTGIISGDFKKLKKNLPTEIDLVLKKDAQVMFVKNDIGGRWVNGTLGKIHSLEEGVYIEVKSESDGQKYIYPVEQEKWDFLRYRFDHETGRIQAEVVASFSQYPVKLAWAFTIHKSQGLTLDKMILDIGNGAFAYGQTYVALSRCKTFEGIRLRRRLRPTDIKVDPAIHRVKERFDINKTHYFFNTSRPEKVAREDDDININLHKVEILLNNGLLDAARKELDRLFPAGWHSDPRYVQLKRKLYADRNTGAAQT